jgi:3-deoxy-D-manno-octulosonic-acid transferase
MPSLYDVGYALLLIASAPIWLVRRSLRSKLSDALRTRLGRVAARPAASTCVWIHAVSVGELNAARALVEQLLVRRPDLHIAISTTTTTGHTRAVALFGALPGFNIVRFPLDFTFALRRYLDSIRPDLLVLMELEVWPNLARVCERRRVPIVIANGRMTEPSFRRYRMLGWLSRRMFARVTRVVAQDQVQADRFARVGVAAERILVAGTMKFDSASTEAPSEPSERLASDLGIDPAHPLLVAGSTGLGEEAMLLSIFRALLEKHPSLQLALVPRKPERFDEVATLIEREGFMAVRRSGPTVGSISDDSRPVVFLIDTVGELRAVYALATVVFVGRTLVDLGPKQHGSDMIEPAALGKPVVVGPFTGNFAEPMRAFREARAILEVRDASELYASVDRLLSDEAIRSQLGTRARRVVIDGKGAVKTHLDVIESML